MTWRLLCFVAGIYIPVRVIQSDVFSQGSEYTAMSLQSAKIITLMEAARFEVKLRADLRGVPEDISQGFIYGRRSRDVNETGASFNPDRPTQLMAVPKSGPRFSQAQKVWGSS